jgi:acylphosphatase
MPESDRVRRHVWVTGRVQNVWFRDACRREAQALGVDGWVRNLPDHRVEATFEGSPAAVEAMVAWCHTGPPRARVTRVDAHEELPTHETGFTIQ